MRTVCFNFRWLTHLRHLFGEESSYLIQTVLFWFSFWGIFESNWSSFLSFFFFLLEAFGLMKWVLSLILDPPKWAGSVQVFFVSSLSHLDLQFSRPHNNWEESSDKTTTKRHKYSCSCSVEVISYTACSLRSSNKGIRFLVAVEAVEKVCNENFPDLSL